MTVDNLIPAEGIERIEKYKAKQELHNEFVKDAPPFQEWAKIARLKREIVITEKIDGTNACVVITPEGKIFAQSRTRIISPFSDNFGFATWVENNKETLLLLGQGHHYGEWFGAGIQRGYGLTEKRFYLFNTIRWEQPGQAEVFRQITDVLPNVGVVPKLYEGPWDCLVDGELRYAPDYFIEVLRSKGSQVVPFMNPEGIVIYHRASCMSFKQTIENDAEPKGKANAKPVGTQSTVEEGSGTEANIVPN
jgi:hypothetical protein